jgi:hypothetical protein
MTDQVTRFKVGQKWRTRGGLIDTITSADGVGDYPIQVSSGYVYTCAGRFDSSKNTNEMDLVHLVSEAPDDTNIVPEQSVVDAFMANAQSTTQIEMFEKPVVATSNMNVAGYETLADVLQRAYNQAAVGKGVERHSAAGEPFHEQVMQIGAAKFGHGALLFQAFKKSEESQRLPHDRAINELLGAINYLAGAVIALEIKKDTA